MDWNQVTENVNILAENCITVGHLLRRAAEEIGLLKHEVEVLRRRCIDLSMEIETLRENKHAEAH